MNFTLFTHCGAETHTLDRPCNAVAAESVGIALSSAAFERGEREYGLFDDVAKSASHCDICAVERNDKHDETLPSGKDSEMMGDATVDLPAPMTCSIRDLLDVEFEKRPDQSTCFLHVKVGHELKQEEARVKRRSRAFCLLALHAPANAGSSFILTWGVVLEWLMAALVSSSQGTAFESEPGLGTICTCAATNMPSSEPMVQFTCSRTHVYKSIMSTASWRCPPRPCRDVVCVCAYLPGDARIRTSRGDVQWS